MAAVKAVKKPHHKTPRVSIRLGPKRSASHPAGVWKSAYPKRNALKTRPRRTLLMANSSEIFAPAMERLTLSRNATALRTKSKKMRNQRTWLVGGEVIYSYSGCLPAGRNRQPSNGASRLHAVWDLKS